MKVSIKFNDTITTYPTIAEAEKFLNSALYYCDTLMMCSHFENYEEYTNKTDIGYEQRQARLYGEGYITVIQIFES